MMFPLLALIVPLMLTGTPSALAYLSPEEVLLQEQTSYYQPTPTTAAPNPRTLREQYNDEMLNRERRLLEQQGQIPKAAGFGSSSSSEESVQHPSAGTETGVEDGTITQDQQDILDLKMLRLLEQLDSGSAGEMHNANSLMGQQEKPLTPTGPGTVAAVGILLASAAWILFRAARGKAWLPHLGSLR